MLKNWLLRACACVGLILPLNAPAEAETWVVGSMEDFAPFNYTLDGKYMGIDVQILEEAVAMIGVDLEHHPLPWKRALLDFDAGNLDAVFQLTPTPERFEKWNMVGPLRTTKTVFATTIDSSIQDVKAPQDLEGVVVGVVNGFTYDDDFDARTDIAREYSQDDFTNMRKLLLGRADVIVGGITTLNYIARELNAQEKIRFLPTPLVEHDRYIAFHKNQTGSEMSVRLQEALSQMHTSGRIPEIVQNHLNK